MFRRSLLILPAVAAALALPVSSAFAGEDPNAPAVPPPAAPGAPAAPGTPAAPTGSASLHSSQGCSTGHRARASVTGSGIASVTFFVDGKRITTDSSADSSGSFTALMSCSRLHRGSNSAKAVVAFSSGASQTLQFHITRTAATTPRFAG
jgi:hypothetical protein